MDALGAVGAHWAHLTLGVDAQLVAVLAVWPTFIHRQGLLGARGQTDRAQFTSELALGWLEAPVTAGTTKVSHLVIVTPGGAFLLALAAAGCPQALCDALNALDCGTLDAGSLREFGIVLAHWTLGAHALGLVEEGAGRAWHALVVHHHLAEVTAEALLEGDGAGVQLGARQSVVDSLKFVKKTYV